MPNFVRYDQTTGAILGWGMMDQHHIDWEARTFGGIMLGTAISLTDQIVDLSQDPLVIIPTSAIPLNLDQAQMKAITAVAANRWAAQILGFTIDGVTISTDPTTAGILLGKYTYIQLNPSAMTMFKTMDGVFVNMTGAQITAFAMAIEEYIQDCFTNEGAISAAILACTTPDEVAAIDLTAGWPATS